MDKTKQAWKKDHARLAAFFGFGFSIFMVVAVKVLLIMLRYYYINIVKSRCGSAAGIYRGRFLVYRPVIFLFESQLSSLSANQPNPAFACLLWKRSASRIIFYLGHPTSGRSKYSNPVPTFWAHYLRDRRDFWWANTSVKSHNRYSKMTTVTW